MLARYTSDSHIFCDKIGGGGKSLHDKQIRDIGWWHCVRTEPIDIDMLTAKQRYRVRRGLQRNDIFMASVDDIDMEAEGIYQAYLNSIADYPKVYLPTPSPKDTFICGLKQLINDKSDLWLCRDKKSGNIVGYAHTPYRENVVFLSSLKLDPAYFKNEVNAALVYEICRYYLNEKNFAYIIDGERNIRHQTAYQDFLVSVLGFRKAPCTLNIVYHPAVKPIIAMLYPLRNILKPLARSNKLLFNIYCILLQEQCARECRQN